MKKIVLVLSIVAGIWGFSLTCFAVSRTVCPGNPQAFQTIQAAINASVAGDIIYVCAGEYRENVIMKPGVSVWGKENQWPVVKPANPNVSVVTFNNANISHDTVLARLVITEGHAMSGGGIYIASGASPNIFQNRINLNTGKFGAGICVKAGCNPAILFNTITECFAVEDSNGGAIYLISPGPQTLILGNDIINNCADFGGGIYAYYMRGTIAGNTFEENQVIQDGGGMAIIYGYNDLLVNANSFKNNGAERGAGMFFSGLTYPGVTYNNFELNLAGFGGAIYMEKTSLDIAFGSYLSNDASIGGGIYIADLCKAVTLSGLDMRYNSACDNEGGAIYLDTSARVSITNCVLFRNKADVGSGISVEDATDLKIINNTFVENLYFNGSKGAGILLKHGVEGYIVNNWILKHNRGIEQIAGGPAVAENNYYYSNTKSMFNIAGPNNVFSPFPPCFVEWNNDFHILSTDPGTNNGVTIPNVTPEIDMDGEARPEGDSIDVGADECWLD